MSDLSNQTFHGIFDTLEKLLNQDLDEAIVLSPKPSSMSVEKFPLTVKVFDTTNKKEAEVTINYYGDEYHLCVYPPGMLLLKDTLTSSPSLGYKKGNEIACLFLTFWNSLASSLEESSDVRVDYDKSGIYMVDECHEDLDRASKAVAKASWIIENGIEYFFYLLRELPEE
mgnify:CR=1 FL=1